MYIQIVPVIKKNKIFGSILKDTEEKSRIRILNPVYGSEDPDPFQNITGLN